MHELIQHIGIAAPRASQGALWAGRVLVHPQAARRVAVLLLGASRRCSLNSTKNQNQRGGSCRHDGNPPPVGLLWSVQPSGHHHRRRTPRPPRSSGHRCTGAGAVQGTLWSSRLEYTRQPAGGGWRPDRARRPAVAETPVPPKVLAAAMPRRSQGLALGSVAAAAATAGAKGNPKQRGAEGPRGAAARRATGRGRQGRDSSSALLCRGALRRRRRRQGMRARLLRRARVGVLLATSPEGVQCVCGACAWASAGRGRACAGQVHVLEGPVCGCANQKWRLLRSCPGERRAGRPRKRAPPEAANVKRPRRAEPSKASAASGL